MGASKPWPDALEALTGERRWTPTAMLEYFAPLAAWLKEQNKGQSAAGEHCVIDFQPVPDSRIQ